MNEGLEGELGEKVRDGGIGEISGGREIDRVSRELGLSFLFVFCYFEMFSRDVLFLFLRDRSGYILFYI